MSAGSFCRSPSRVTQISPRSAPEARLERRALTRVRREAEHADARVPLREREELRARVVGAAVVHVDELDAAGEVRQRRVELAVQRLDVVGLVVERHDDGEPGGAFHQGSRQRRNQLPNSRPWRAADPIVTCSETRRRRSTMKPYTKRERPRSLPRTAGQPGGALGGTRV